MPYPETIQQQLEQVWRSPDMPVLDKLRKTQFVAHSIPLTADESTRPGEPLISQSPRTIAIHESLQRFMGPDLAGKTALDLGCLEGGLSFELRRAGLTVLGVEGRAENYERCLLIRHYYRALGGLEFAHSDVREFRPARTFDAVVCSGLLYHLDDPAAYIGELGRLTSPGGMLYLDTHVAPEDACLASSEYHAWLSGLKTGTAGGIAIRYREYSEDISLPESSIGNTYSVWMDLNSHLELMFDAGFNRIFELHGYFGAGEQELKQRYCRRYFVALKGTHPPMPQ
jgi:2-polyprenyl-3-methyl-5-hydroxy-6-metoxy-1,4-benzoquinol methylase